MSEQSNNNSGNGGFGCLGWLVLGLVLGVIAMGGFGAVLDEAAQRSRIDFPHIPIDASTLGVQSSVVVLPTPAPTAIVYEPVVVYQAPAAEPVVVPFVVQQPACTVPEGWRVGVSPLPDCWESLSREEQNDIIRSH